MLPFRLCLELETATISDSARGMGFSAFSSQLKLVVCVLGAERVLLSWATLPWSDYQNQSWGGGETRRGQLGSALGQKARVPVVLSQSSVVFLEKYFASFICL